MASGRYYEIRCWRSGSSPDTGPDYGWSCLTYEAEYKEPQAFPITLDFLEGYTFRLYNFQNGLNSNRNPYGGYKHEFIYDANLGGNSLKLTDPDATAYDTSSGLAGNAIIQPKEWFSPFQGTVTAEQKIKYTGSVTSNKAGQGWGFFNCASVYAGIYFKNGDASEPSLYVYGESSVSFTNIPSSFQSGHVYTFKFVYTPGALRSDDCNVKVYLDTALIIDATFPALSGPFTVWNQFWGTNGSPTPTNHLTAEIGPISITCSDSNAMTVMGEHLGPWQFMELRSNGWLSTGTLGGVWGQENVWDCAEGLTVGSGWYTRTSNYGASRNFTGKLDKMFIPAGIDSPSLKLLGIQRYGSLHVHIEDGDGNLVSDDDIASNSTGFTPTSQTSPLAVDLANVKGQYIQIRIDGSYDGTIGDITWDEELQQWDPADPTCARTPSLLNSAYVEFVKPAGYTTTTTTTTTTTSTTTTTTTTSTTTTTPEPTTTTTTTTTTTLAPVAPPSTKSLNILVSNGDMLEYSDVESGELMIDYDEGVVAFSLVAIDDNLPVRVKTSLGIKCLN